MSYRLIKVGIKMMEICGSPSKQSFNQTEVEYSTMEQFEFHDATSHPNRSWVQVEPGIYEMILNEDSTSGRKTLLQRWDPNTANVKDNFVHPYIEEIFIVEGDLADTRLNEKWVKGAYAYRKPGMNHGPFRSEEGCLMFITCSPV